jgi:hypothetical protein
MSYSQCPNCKIGLLQEDKAIREELQESKIMEIEQVDSVQVLSVDSFEKKKNRTKEIVLVEDSDV